MPYRVRNWRRFQHYKDRRPPWIKLHTSILTDRDFMALDFCSQGLLVQLWVLASESKDGTVTSDLEDLSFRLHKRVTKNDVSPLMKKFLVIVDENVILLADASPVKALDVPEGETEGEGETETEHPLPPQGGVSEIQTKSGNGNGHHRPRFVAPTVGEVREFCEAKHSQINPVEFVAFYESKGWKIGSSPMKNWKAAIATWELRR